MTAARLSDAQLAKIRAASSGWPHVDLLLAEVDARGREIHDLHHEVMAHQVSDGYEAGYHHGTLATLDRIARDMGLDRRTEADNSANWGRQVLDHVARLAAQRNEAQAAPEATGARGGVGSSSPDGRCSGSVAAS